MSTSRTLALAVLVLFVGSAAQAQMLLDGPPPQHRIMYRSLISVRYNPLQLIGDLRATYRLRLFRSDSKVLRDNFLGAGLSVTATPASITGGAHLEFAPASVLQFYGWFDVWRWFGNFNFTQSFRNAEDNWGPNEQARLGQLPAGDPARNYGSTGFTFTGGAILQGRVGDFGARNHARVIYGIFSLRAGDRFYYEPYTDLMMQNGGWSFMNDTDVTYSFGRFGMGLRLSLAKALYRLSVLTPGIGDPNPWQTRVGPTLMWTFFKEQQRLFNPTLLLSVSWFMTHRFRTGADVSQAIPQLQLAVVLWGDVLPVPTPDGR